MLPRGVVLCELETDAGGWKDDPLTEDAELMVDEGDRVAPLISVEIELTLAFFAGSSGVSRDTIFMPRPLSELAGMKSVVTPRRLMIALCGWKEDAHIQFVSPVEYSWSASARLDCSCITSSFFKDSSSARTSESGRMVRGIVDRIARLF